MIKFRRPLVLLAAAAALATGTAGAQTIKIANIVELSGAGATSGTNFKDGVELAVKEINAAGGSSVTRSRPRHPTRRATRRGQGSGAKGHR